MASLPGNGERGLKPALPASNYVPPQASLPGNGERGLKRSQRRALGRNRRASLPGNGERGLKPWICSRLLAIYTASLPGNGERGLKLKLLTDGTMEKLGFAPRQRGAWIETSSPQPARRSATASLPGSGERGLKLRRSGTHPRRTQASLSSNSERAVRSPRKCGAGPHLWIPAFAGMTATLMPRRNWLPAFSPAAQTTSCQGKSPRHIKRRMMRHRAVRDFASEGQAHEVLGRDVLDAQRLTVAEAEAQVVGGIADEEAAVGAELA